MIFAGSLGLNYLSPSAPIGIILLISGVFFTTGIIYILYLSTADKMTLAERKTLSDKRKKQAEEIAKLYPNK